MNSPPTKCVVLSTLLVLATWTSASAIPVIHSVEGGSPAHAQPGSTVLFLAEGLEEPLQVLFSDGANPTVAATEVGHDPDRGFLMVRVPAGAVTGDMKITANGVDSDPYRFEIDAGSLAQGTRQVSGQVTDGTNPIAGAAVALLAFDDCDDDVIWDFGLTDATGNYSLLGQDGDHFIYVFPPLDAGVAAGGMEVSLGATRLSQDLVLDAGTLVQGRVVLTADPQTGVSGSRVDFESEEDGFDSVLTDVDGYYSLRLPTGNYELEILPGSGWSLSTMGMQDVAVGATSPQQLADIETNGGIEITGVVRRASDLSPLSNVEINVRDMDTCCDDIDFTESAGDGSFTLVVPPNRTYTIEARVDDDQPYVNLWLNDFVVGGSDVTQNLDLADAAFITGVVSDAVSGLPLFDVGVQANTYPYDGMSSSWANSCEDGSFRLRVEPSSQGYLVSSSAWQETGYVPVTWDNTPDGTLFPCEGLPVAVPTAGATASSIDLPMPPGAGSISGNVLTQDSSCVTTVDEQVWVDIDDGAPVGCTLGVNDWSQPNGSFRVHSLPHEGLLAGLRVCVYSIQDAAPQCYNLKTPPSYDAVMVPVGQEVGNVNFCVGSTPELEIAPQMTAEKVGNEVMFSWPSSVDPYHDRYRLRGALSPVPAGPGSFPIDPVFDELYTGFENWTQVSIDSPYSFFLVTDVGSSDAEGPSGSYEN